MFFNIITTKKSAASSKKMACRTKKTPTQVVCSTRWVHRSQLEVGMYVSELDVSWEETGFMFQGFYIDSNELLFQVQDACKHARVQTEKLSQISRKPECRLLSSRSLTS